MVIIRDRIEREMHEYDILTIHTPMKETRFTLQDGTKRVTTTTYFDYFYDEFKKEAEKKYEHNLVDWDEKYPKHHFFKDRNLIASTNRPVSPSYEIIRGNAERKAMLAVLERKQALNTSIVTNANAYLKTLMTLVKDELKEFLIEHSSKLKNVKWARELLFRTRDLRMRQSGQYTWLADEQETIGLRKLGVEKEQKPQ